MAAAFGETPIGLSSQILNIAGVLTRKAALKVPRYQRPYTWTEREVRQLIQDLRRAYLRGATFYFIGQIVLVKGQHGKLEISDGQQRLATMTMILAYVRDRLPHRASHYQQLILLNEGHGKPRLSLRDEDANFYWGYVQEPMQMSKLASLDEMGVDSKDLLIGAARVIAAELGEMSDRDLDAFMSYIVRATTLNVIDADERGCAATVYNTVNDRGLALSAADNMKCDLLENSRLSPQDADAAARKWDELEGQVGREHFAKLLTEMPFLLTGEDLISPGDLGAFRAQVEAVGGVRNFLFDQLPRYGRVQRHILKCTVDAGPATAEVNRRLKMLQQLDVWNWCPAALAHLAGHRGSHEKTRRFFQALDRFAFACELSVIESKVRIKRFAQAVRMASDEKAYLPGGPLDLSDSERLHFLERLNRSSRRDRQRRLIMLRVEAAMPGGNVLALTDDVSVEHVLPRAGGPWWNDRFPNKAMREDLANYLGNLVLITPEQNEEADVKPFPQKKEIFFRAGPPVHAVTKHIRQVNEWTADVINARHEELVRILGNDWELTRPQ